MATLPFSCSAIPLSANAFQNAMDSLGIDSPTLWAMLHVETRGCGYFASRRPQILFERHIFSRLTQGAWDATAPDVSNPLPGGYGASGDFQYSRLGKAYGLDPSAQDAALKSTSWGLGQVLGLNASSVGYQSVRDMVAAMAASEDQQLKAVVSFILTNKLQNALQTQNWAAYAAGYNGENYAQNHYDTNLAETHALYQDPSQLPDLTIRAGQLALFLLGYDPKGIDGAIGPNTLTALHNFQSKQQIPLTTGIDSGVLATLTAALPAPAQLSLS
jgi:N-acetylmuramidase